MSCNLCWFCQDPIEAIRAKCEETEHCVHYKQRLEICEARVSSKSHTEEDCTEELFDFLHARDHCVSLTYRNIFFFFNFVILMFTTQYWPNASPTMTTVFFFHRRCRTSSSIIWNDPLDQFPVIAAAHFMQPLWCGIFLNGSNLLFVITVFQWLWNTFLNNTDVQYVQDSDYRLWFNACDDRCWKKSLSFVVSLLEHIHFSTSIWKKKTISGLVRSQLFHK